MKYKLIVTASGSGKRIGTEVPKQFLLINKKPIIFYTIEQFYKYSPDIEIIITLNENYISYWNNLIKEYNFNIKHRIVKGGITRYDSVKNAIKTINESCLVAVHDAVRPFVSINTISRCFAVAEKKGNAVPYIEISDSIRHIDKGANSSVERSKFVKIQTPQIFNINLIKKAYSNNNCIECTDDASLVESINEKIHLVKGNIENFKITTQYDLKISELYTYSYKKINV